MGFILYIRCVPLLSSHFHCSQEKCDVILSISRFVLWFLVFLLDAFELFSLSLVLSVWLCCVLVLLSSGLCACGSLNFLDLCVYDFHQLWEIFDRIPSNIPPTSLHLSSATPFPCVLRSLKSSHNSLIFFVLFQFLFLCVFHCIKAPVAVLRVH